MTRKKHEVVAEATELAEQFLAESGEDMSLEAARSHVWEALPELYAEYRGADLDEPVVEVAKSSGDMTVAEAVAAAVHAEADRRAWTEWPDKTVEQIRGDLWLSKEGSQLFDLARSQYGQQPMWQARQTIRKSAAFADAWRIFEEWR